MLINRVAAMAAIETKANADRLVSLADVRDALNSLEGIDPATLAPKWISVEERLPSDERSVLAYYGFDNDGDGDLGMMFMGTLSYFCFDPQPHWQHESTGLIVTHWMPLPEPPKEGENNGENE